MTTSSRARPIEAFLVLIFTLGLVRLCFELRHVSFMAPYIALIVAGLLIYIPLFYARWRQEPITYLDRSWSDVKRSLKWFSIWLAIIAVPFLVGNHFWQHWVFKTAFMPRILPHLGWTFVDQFFLIAIPEEVFFRGWFQPKVHGLFQERWNIFGVRLGWGWILGAVIFAFAHTLIHYQWWQFAIFFPALLFAWLKEKTGTVLAPALFHCIGNIGMYWIAMSYV